MATIQEVRESLQAFQTNYQGNARLQEMNRGWDRVIRIEVKEHPDVFTLILENGELRLEEESDRQPQIVVQGDSEVVASVFFGELAPTEPYLKGELTVNGSQEDVLRLDFISLMIWGA